MALNIGIGEMYSLACGLAWAIAVVLFKKSGESLPPFALNLFKNAVGADDRHRGVGDAGLAGPAADGTGADAGFPRAGYCAG